MAYCHRLAYRHTLSNCYTMAYSNPTAHVNASPNADTATYANSTPNTYVAPNAGTDADPSPDTGPHTNPFGPYSEAVCDR